MAGAVRPLLAAWAVVVPMMAVPVLAQPVVQPLPPAGVDDLNAALRRLGSNPDDVGALIAAGNASLKVGDIDAAIGFFGRAAEFTPGDARIKVGLAQAMIRREQPVDAIRLFEEAERAGAPTATIAADRGLAYDLVGDNARAQMYYAQALARGPDAEVTRRLALSQAMAGDRKAAEATILPQLRAQDRAAFRTRAFLLAILGDVKDATEIADASMPGPLAAKITPYLGYMPRLTKAQQAAAANFGSFPRAADIGRDDPRLAAYAPPAPTPTRVAAASDTRLAPAGQALGSAPPVRESRTERRVRLAREQAAQDAAERARRVARVAASTPARGTSIVAASPSFPAAQPAVRPTPATGPSSGELPALAEARPAPVAATPARANAAPLVLPSAAPTPILVASAAPAGAALRPSIALPLPATAAPEPTLADAFAAFALSPPTASSPAAGAVDLTKFEPKREVERVPEPVARPVAKARAKPAAAPKPAEPKQPSRIWVQLATGRDTKALAFDWRKLARGNATLFKARDGFVTPWGQANRLLTGPFDTPADARQFLNDLAKAKIDSFVFTSPAGQEIVPIGGK